MDKILYAVGGLVRGSICNVTIGGMEDIGAEVLVVELEGVDDEEAQQYCYHCAGWASTMAQFVSEAINVA